MLIAECGDNLREIEYGIGEITWGMHPKPYLMAVTCFDKNDEQIS